MTVSGPWAPVGGSRSAGLGPSTLAGQLPELTTSQVLTWPVTASSCVASDTV